MQKIKKSKKATSVEKVETGTDTAGAVPVKTVSLPKGISSETYEEVKATIISGFKAKQDPDTIKSAIFSSGVPFSQLNRLYTMITTAEGLVASAKDITEGIATGIKAANLTFDEDYAELATLADSICESVQGVAKTRVISVLKKTFKEAEKEFPRRPAPARGRMGMVPKILINVFKENPQASQDDCEKALVKFTKTPKNANDYAKQYHKMCYALANHLSALEVLTKFPKDA